MRNLYQIENDLNTLIYMIDNNMIDTQSLTYNLNSIRADVESIRETYEVHIENNLDVDKLKVSIADMLRSSHFIHDV